LVWEQKVNTNTSVINYCLLKETLKPGMNDPSWFLRREGDILTVSMGSGFDKNEKPNIITFFDNNSDSLYTHIGWIGIRKYLPYNTYEEIIDKRAVFKTLSIPDRFFVFGDDVQSVSLNRSNTRWVFAWSRSNDLPIQFVDSRDINLIQQLSNLKGVDVQITNGIVPDDMYAFTLNTSSSPYPVNYRAIFGDQIQSIRVILFSQPH